MNNQTGDHYRHGDILLTVVDTIPEGAIALQSVVVAEGEATGHAHTLCPPKAKRQAKKPDFEMFERGGQLFFRSGPRGVAIRHQEHAPIDLPPNCCFAVIHQREWSPKGPKRVVD